MTPNHQNVFEAVEKNDLARLLMSLARGMDPNVRDSNGRSLIIAACQNDGDRHAFVDALMERGADPGYVGPNGRTALHELCAKPLRNMHTLQMLLSAEVELNRQDDAGQTPLHALAERGWMEGCMELLDSAPVPKGLCNQQDNLGRTPLFVAAAHPALVCMLISYGADPRIEDVNGQNVLHRVDDPIAQSMLLAQSKALYNVDALAVAATMQPDQEFTDLMGLGKAVLAKDFLAKAIGKKSPGEVPETLPASIKKL